MVTAQLLQPLRTQTGRYIQGHHGAGARDLRRDHEQVDRRSRQVMPLRPLSGLVHIPWGTENQLARPDLVP
jgi:hypothetical protein